MRVLARIISLLRKKGSVSHSGPAGLSPHQKALWTLFAAERANRGYFRDYFTSKLEVSPLEEMSTGALSVVIQDIITVNQWATCKVSIDLGSSLITAVQDTSKAVADLQDEEEANQEATMDKQKAKKLISGLRNEGFEVKIPFSKASFHQAKIESIIGSFKTAFRATQLPGSSPLSIVTFIIVIRRCAALLSSRPIAILTPSLADPIYLSILSTIIQTFVNN